MEYTKGRDRLRKKEVFLMLKSIRNSLILSSLLYIVLGVVLLVMPELSLGFACLLIGGAVLVYGVVRLAAYLRGGENSDKLDLVLGVLLILLGLCLLIWIRFLLALVPMVLGIYILVDSLGSIKRSLDMKALGFSRWWISCLVAAALAVCGLVMVLNPFGTIEGLVMFVGLGFLVDGVTTLVNTILLERLQR